MVQVEKIQQTALSVFKDLDLYGNEVLLETLKQYPFISWCDKSIPKLGSPTRLTKDISVEMFKALKVNKITAHKDFKTTIHTDKGVYQFFACGMQNS